MTDASDGVARRRRLNGIKLQALVREHLAVDDLPAPRDFAPGAALVHDGAAWMYLDEQPATGLGPALAVASRSGASEVHVIAERDTGILARRAAEFALPTTVWHAVERTLLPAVADPAEPARPAPAAHEALRPLIEAGGADPVVEHGVLFGEVRGLEVCRVVDDPHLDVTRLEVGVGAHDREAFQMLHGDLPPVDSLRRIVAAVADHRRVGAPRHPLNRLAAERFLRWRLEQEPMLVGATELAPAPPPVPRPNLKDPVPCVARGTDGDGRDVVVVCASGVDLDVVPFAADARLAAEAAPSGVGGSRLVVAMPARDRLEVIDELAGLLRRPAELVSIG